MDLHRLLFITALVMLFLDYIERASDIIFALDTN